MRIPKKVKVRIENTHRIGEPNSDNNKYKDIKLSSHTENNIYRSIKRLTTCDTSFFQ